MKYILFISSIILNVIAYAYHIYEWKHDAILRYKYELIEVLLYVFLIYTLPLILIIVIIATT